MTKALLLSSVRISKEMTLRAIDNLDCKPEFIVRMKTMIA